jgi:hypothetical protein
MFDRRPLTIIWSEDPVVLALVVVYTGEMDNHAYLLLVLMQA